MKKALTVLYLLLICVFGSACATGYVVDSSGDQSDVNLNDNKCETYQGTCTLRAAIENANLLDDVSRITFDPTVSHITPNSPLPKLTASNTHIDGDNNVLLDGVDKQTAGLIIHDSKYNIIQGLRIMNFSHGVWIQSVNEEASHNKIGMINSNLGDNTVRNTFLNNNKPT